MYERVTVDEAIAKGHRMVNYPAIAIIFGVQILCICLGALRILSLWAIPVGFVLSIPLGWLYWSVMITKWRLWAFENVRNVHELKKRAVQEKLIWPDNSVLEQTEIRSWAEKEKWLSLQNKFGQEDLFVDDQSVPGETIIYYSKGKNFFEMAVMLGCFGTGLYILIASDHYIVGSLLSLVGVYAAYQEYKEATNKAPQIVINDQGIKTSSTPFYPWADIEQEEVIREGSGKHVNHYLTYTYPEGSERLKIDDFETDQKSLNKLLRIYRGRSRQKSSFR